MGSLSTRIFMGLAYLVGLPCAIYFCAKYDSVLATIILWILVGAFFIIWPAIGALLFADPLPPRKGDVCEICGDPAKESEHYWERADSNIPVGKINLCRKCNRAWYAIGAAVMPLEIAKSRIRTATWYAVGLHISTRWLHFSLGIHLCEARLPMEQQPLGVLHQVQDATWKRMISRPSLKRSVRLTN